MKFKPLPVRVSCLVLVLFVLLSCVPELTPKAQASPIALPMPISLPLGGAEVALGLELDPVESIVSFYESFQAMMKAAGLEYMPIGNTTAGIWMPNENSIGAYVQTMAAVYNGLDESSKAAMWLGAQMRSAGESILEFSGDVLQNFYEVFHKQNNVVVNDDAAESVSYSLGGVSVYDFYLSKLIVGQGTTILIPVAPIYAGSNSNGGYTEMIYYNISKNPAIGMLTLGTTFSLVYYTADMKTVAGQASGFSINTLKTWFFYPPAGSYIDNRRKLITGIYGNTGTYPPSVSVSLPDYTPGASVADTVNNVVSNINAMPIADLIVDTETDVDTDVEVVCVMPGLEEWLKHIKDQKPSEPPQNDPELTGWALIALVLNELQALLDGDVLTTDDDYGLIEILTELDTDIHAGRWNTSKATQLREKVQELTPVVEPHDTPPNLEEWITHIKKLKPDKITGDDSEAWEAINEVLLELGTLLSMAGNALTTEDEYGLIEIVEDLDTGVHANLLGISTILDKLRQRVQQLTPKYTTGTGTDTGTQTGNDTDTGDDTGEINWKRLSDGWSGLKAVFPFCIPFDLVNMIGSFVAEPVRPEPIVFDHIFPFLWERYGIASRLELDIAMEEFDGLRNLIRIFLFLLFAAGLAIMTSKVIKW